MEINLILDNLDIKLDEKNSFVRDSKNFLELKFNFLGDVWNKLEVKNAYFSYKDMSYSVIIENNKCLVPAELMKNPYFLIGVGGSYIKDGKTVSVYSKNFKILLTKSCYNEMCLNAEDITTVSEQIFGKLNEITGYFNLEKLKYDIIDCDLSDEIFPINILTYCKNDEMVHKVFYFKNTSGYEMQIEALPKQVYTEKSFVVIKNGDKLYLTAEGEKDLTWYGFFDGDNFSGWSEIYENIGNIGLKSFEISKDEELSSVIFTSTDGEKVIIDNESGLIQTSYTDGSGQRAWVTKFLIPEEFISVGKLNSNALGNASVTEAKISDNSISTNKISDGAVTESKLETSLYQKIDTASMLAQQNFNSIENLSVTADKISDGAVTESKLDAEFLDSLKARDGITSLYIETGAIAGDDDLIPAEFNYIRFPNGSYFKFVVSDDGKVNLLIKDINSDSTVSIADLVQYDYLFNYLNNEFNKYQKKDLYLKNVTAAAADFVSDSTYSSYPYKAVISADGVTAEMTANIVFSLEDSISGNFAPVCNTNENTIEIWAKEIPAEDISIPLIEVKNV